MQSIRRSSSVLLLAVLAVLVGGAPALAQPAPLVDPERGAQTGSASTGSGGFFDGWLEVGLAVVLVVAVAAVGLAVLSRLSHRSPSHA